MAQAPFVIRPDLSGTATLHKNQSTDYIADLIAPRETVAAEEFQWDEISLQSMYQVPDTRVGRTSKPNQVSFDSTRRASSTQDYALDIPVPNKDIRNSATSNGAADPEGIAAMGATELLMLDREIRMAGIVFAAATYLADQRTTLSGASQWSDASSNPIKAILLARDSMLVDPTHLVISQPAWTQMRTHPKVVEAVKGTGAKEGVAMLEQVAEILELKGILKGMGWKDAAKPGQAFNRVRVWGNHAALITVNPIATLRGAVMPTFMKTAEFGSLRSGTIEDPDMGAEGGVRVRAMEQVKEVVIAQTAGYFFQNVIA